MNNNLNILRSCREEEMIYIRDLRKKNKLKIREELKNVYGKGLFNFNLAIILKNNYLKKENIISHF